MKVALVGNGPVAQDYSAIIDSCDVVVRVNMCSTYGGNTGTRLDVLALCNTGVAAVHVMNPRSNHFIGRAPEIWLSRNPCLYNEMRLHFRGQMAEQFFEEYSWVVTGPAFKGKVIRAMDYTLGATLFEKLGKLQGQPFVMPSTGIRLLEELIQSPDLLPQRPSMVYVVGFTHEGWPGHPWAAERALVDQYVAEGRVTRLI